MKPFLRSLLLLLAWAALLRPGNANAQAGASFSCDGTFYQTKQSGTGASAYSVLYIVNRSTSTYTTAPITSGTYGSTGVIKVGTTNLVVNALAYNSQNGYMYAVTYPADNGTATVNPHIYQLGQEGVTDLGATNLPIASFASGTFDISGNYYLTSRENTGSVYSINIATNPLAATVIPLRNAANTANTTATIYDLAYNPVDSSLYGVYTDGYLVKLTLNATPQAIVTTIGSTTGSSQIIGSAFFDISGRLFAYSNGALATAGSGRFYSVDLSTGVYTQLSSIDPVSSSDGASCINPGNRIDVTKTLVSAVPVDARTFDVTYNIQVRNTYSTTDTYVQVSDLLTGSASNTPFPTASSVTITSAPVVTNTVGNTTAPSLVANTSYTGLSGNAGLLDGNQTLAPGQQAIIAYTVRVVFPAGAVPATAQNNTAYATSTSTGPNKGYTLLSNGSLLTPNNLVANDASTNSNTYPVLRTSDSDTGDVASPTPVTFPPSISGTVFEDVNYGGGLGRSLSTSVGVGRSGARVELYVGTGDSATFNQATTTGTNGSYNFLSLTPGTTYTVRVVNSTVTSSRNTGAATGLVGVQTYSTSVPASGITTPNLNRVGGENPKLIDGGNGSLTAGVSTTLGSLTAESIAPVILPANGTAALSVDFGYNFDAVVNTNDAGQGSLRQFILNSNALTGEAALAQVYTATDGTTTALTPGLETSIFTIPNGTAVAGQQASLASGFGPVSGGTAATITLASALPAITGPLTAIDGSTQTNSTGNTNASSTAAGAESTGPEVIVNLNNFAGLAFSGPNESLLNLGVNGSAAASSGVLVNGTATGLTVAGNTLYTNGANVSILSGATGNTIKTNVIRSSTRTSAGGIVAQSGTSNNVFSQNSFDSNNGLGIDLTNGTTTNGDGVTLNAAGTRTGANSLLNFPVLNTATVSGTNLVVTGYARPGALVELYLAAADPTNFGAGASYLANFTQGTAVGTTGNVATGAATTYSNNQGTDNTNTFTATIPLSSLMAAQVAALQSGSAILTSTATLSGTGTSEFSGNLTLPVADVTVSLTGPTTLNAGQATGTYVATFTNEGPASASDIARSVTLPTGASLSLTQRNDLIARYAATFTTTGSGATAITTISFGTVALDNKASSLVSFAFTAPNAVSTTLALTANTTSASQGANIAPDQATLTLSTVTTADVAATITAAATTTTQTFTVNFSNKGPQDAVGIVRSVQLPAGLTPASLTYTGDAAGASYNATTGLVTYPATPTTLAAGVGATLTSTISYPVAGALVAPLTATASISTTTSEAGLTANNSASATMPTQFDLTTTLSGPAAAVAGSPVMLYVTTTNNGPNTAGNTTQSVSIPSAATLAGSIYITNGGTYSYSGGVGTVTFPALANVPNGQTITNSISFLAPAAAFAPTATVTTTSGTETNTANNMANLNGGATGTSIAVSTVAALSNEATTIQATVGATTTPATVVDAASTITYTVKSFNMGYKAATASATVVEQVQLLPGLTAATLKVGSATPSTLANGNLSYANAAGTTTYNPTSGLLTYYTVTQAAGDITTYDAIAVTAPAAVGNGGQLLATASVQTVNFTDPVPADNVASVAVRVRTKPDLTTSVSGPGSTVAGLLATYVVRFTNSGTNDAATVTETVQLPAGLSGIGVTDASGNAAGGATYNSGSGLLTFPGLLADAVGTTQTYTIGLTAPAQNFPVTSTIAGLTSDGVATNNSATQLTTVAPNADLTVSVTGPATTVIGNPITYILTTTNNGPNTATGVTPTLQLPKNLASVDVGTGGASYNSATGLLTFATKGTLTPGGSTVNYVTFTMPGATATGDAAVSNGLIIATAAVTSTSADQMAANNTTALTTSVIPATSDVADLVTSLSLNPTSSPTTVPAGTQLNYTVAYRNAGSSPAVSAVGTVNLPTGLSVNDLVLNGTGSGGGTGVKGTQTGNIITFGGTSNGLPAGATYNQTTGLLTFALFATLPASPTSNAYSISFPAPANDVLAISEITSATTDNGPRANRSNSIVTIDPNNPNVDVAAALSGPATAQPGTTVTYAATTVNNGPSQNPNLTVQTVTLPNGVVPVSGSYVGGTYSSANNTITWNIPALQAPGTANAVVNTFSLVMPATGNVALGTSITSTGETTNNPVTGASNGSNNLATLTTIQANQAPVAENIWNTLRGARANNAPALPLSPLLATDADGKIDSYTVTIAPTQGGTLYYNGSAVTDNTMVTASGLSFVPTPGFVGNATFSYVATDDGGAASPPALYTIPLAQDQAAVYATYNSNKATNYANGDVLAAVADPNVATYTTAGTVYDATGNLLANAANGLLLVGTNAVLAGPGPSGNPGNTLPAGISLNAQTGQIYVSDVSATSLVTNPTARTYSVNVTTTDINGGISTQTVTFTTGANPLPVVLTAFTAQAVQNRDALLGWSTASEVNSASFEVERSLDGSIFTKIGQVTAQGTSISATAYTFTDAEVGARAQGSVYYRLRQLDLNGAAAYSPVRTVSFTKAVAVALSVYPNPATTSTSLDLSALPASASYQVVVLDAIGRQVLTTTQAGGLPQPLDLTSLASGTYQVLVTGTLADGTALRQVLRLIKE